MNWNNVRKICRPVRVVVGLVLIGTGVITGNYWFFLGVVPLIAGIVNFCPACMITKQCDI